ncbi:MAG: hypothetical protein SAL07_05270 [Oscillatoria sp. PMC 1051.18]|nr:hypothetical protein [Oscillatoria sp. PMC 1050.18]MEC5029304.1 hypothetical protein [Oscillatoria sp. PMC 1051.18]
MKPLIAWKPFDAKLNAASTRLRVLLPCQYLQEAGWNCEIYNPEKADEYDLVIFQKTCTKEDITLAKKLRKKKIKVVYDLCDNNFYNPYDLQKYSQKAAGSKSMIERANAVTVSTPELQKLIAHPQCIVIDDTIDYVQRNWLKEIPYKLKKWQEKWQDKSFRVVWFGNSKLEIVYKSLGLSEAPSGMVSITKVTPALEELNKRIPVKLTVISNSEELFQEHTQNLSFPTKYYPWQMSTFPLLFCQNDVCIIPIDLNPFTICKTNNRLVTSLSLGLPVVADKIPSYEEFKDFVLFGDWEKNLYRYATNKKLRARHVKEGKEYIKNNYTKKRVVEQWSKMFKTVLKLK